MKESGSFSPIWVFLCKENIFAVKKLLQVQIQPRCGHIFQSHASITRITLSLCCFCCQNLQRNILLLLILALNHFESALLKGQKFKSLFGKLWPKPSPFSCFSVLHEVAFNPLFKILFKVGIFFLMILWRVKCPLEEISSMFSFWY